MWTNWWNFNLGNGENSELGLVSMEGAARFCFLTNTVDEKITKAASYLFLKIGWDS